MSFNQVDKDPQHWSYRNSKLQKTIMQILKILIRSSLTLAKHATNISNWLASLTFYGEYKNVDLIMCTLVSVFERWHNSGCPFVIMSDCQGIHFDQINLKIFWNSNYPYVIVSVGQSINLFNSWVRIFQVWYSGFSVTHIIRTSLCLIVRVSILIKLIWRFSATQIVRTSLCLIVRASKLTKFDIEDSL